MTHDLPPDLWLVVGAAVAVVIGRVLTVIGRWAPRECRNRFIAGLAAWLAVDVALGASGAFAAGAHRPFPGIVAGIVIPIVGGIWALGRPSTLSRTLVRVPAHRLIAVQSYRAAGVVFLLAWAQGRIPAVFALPAGIGDLLVGLAAPRVAARLADGTLQSRRIALIWSVAGIADLIVAIALGALTSPDPIWPHLLGDPNTPISRLPLVLIPVFAVPLSILLHIATLRRLRAAGRAPRTGDAPRRRAATQAAAPTASA